MKTMEIDLWSSEAVHLTRFYVVFLYLGSFGDTLTLSRLRIFCLSRVHFFTGRTGTMESMETDAL